jgi:hypothetical protein
MGSWSFERCACALGHVDAAKALLDAGADLGAEANDKDALAIAREEQKDEVVALLLGEACLTRINGCKWIFFQVNGCEWVCLW